MKNKYNTLDNVKQLLTREIVKATGVKNLDPNDNLFDPKYEEVITPVTLTYAFIEIFNELSLPVNLVLDNYSFNDFSINNISEKVLHQIAN